MKYGKLLTLTIVIGAVAIVMFGIVLWRQEQLRRAQERLDRKIERSPFLEPATTNSTGTAPRK